MFEMFQGLSKRQYINIPCLSSKLQHALHFAFNSNLSRDNQGLYLSFCNHSSRNLHFPITVVFTSVGISHKFYHLKQTYSIKII